MIRFSFLLRIQRMRFSEGTGRFYLYALAGAGQAGVERALENLRAEIERDMKLMGCRSVDQLSRDNLRWR